MTSIDLAGLAVEGISIGGIETCIEVPEWKLAFDVGRCPRSVVGRPTILFTHAHIDHMGGVVMHAATRALLGMKPPTYVVPATNANAFHAVFDAWRSLDRSDLPHEVVELSPGEEHRLRPDLVARAFSAVHRVACQGYIIFREKHRLREELVGLPGDEIARLSRAGTEVNRIERSPELVFTGDTRIEGLERDPDVLRARRLILETTFLDERVSVEQARDKGHVHLDEVVARADLLTQEAILLTHFSARYRRREILELLDARLPPALRERVTPLLEGWRDD